MATIKWDAYRYLNITSRGSHGTSCAGYTKYDQRCRWDISGKNFTRICSMLDDFETEAPAKAVSSLERLAKWSLCEQYHQSQASKKVDEWKVAIQEATTFYERSKALKKKNRELNEMLTEERSERKELEQKVEKEISRRKQELESISSMTLEVTSLKAKLKQVETEVRNSKCIAQKKTKLYDKRQAEHKDELEMLQVKFAKAREEFEEERRKFRVNQAASLSRVDELIQEMARARNHPFRTFFAILFEVSVRWVNSVFAYLAD